MARTRNAQDGPLFTQGSDFNEQLYEALKTSPWWMISIAIHVLLFVVSSLFQGDAAAAVPPPPKTLVVDNANADKPPEEEPTPIDEVQSVSDDDVSSKEPDLRDVPLADHDETDNDNPDSATVFGNDGISSGQWDGPSTNSVIGIGGGRGGAFGRGPGGSRNLKRGSIGGRSDEAVLDALRWLKSHQSPDGGWEAEGFGRWCDGRPASGPGPDGAGKATYDVGVTGLALLAFLGAGYTNRSDDKFGFGPTVAAGLRYLKNVQDPEGCFGARSTSHYVYNHAIAALAMIEAYGMTGSPVFKGPAQKALDFVSISRNPYFAWRYGIKPGDNDTSVTGWMMMALKSAKLVNHADQRSGHTPSFVFDEDAFDGIRTWVDKVTDDEGRAGSQTRGTGPARTSDLVDRFPAEKSESMTAVAMLARIFLGQDPKSDAVRKGAALCAKLPPVWKPAEGAVDMYYWYYATLAMFQVGGPQFEAWNKAMQTAMVDTQRKDGDFCLSKGSWDPVDPWGADGGRVYSTAVLAMCLEVYYRYPRVALTNLDK